MHVECIPCPIKISNAVKKSTRARECLEEVRALTSGDPTCVEIALLPRTREFLSYLQSSLGDTTGQPVADVRIPPPSAIISPTLPTTTHGWVNQVETISAIEGSPIIVPLANELGNVPLTNAPAAFYPPSTLGLYEYVGNIDQSSVLDFGSVSYPAASSSTGEFIPHCPASLLVPVQERASCGENWDFLMPDIAANYELAGPSTAFHSQSDASPHKTRGETLGNAASWNEDALGVWDTASSLAERPFPMVVLLYRGIRLRRFSVPFLETSSMVWKFVNYVLP
ncbi:uncharacterized protein EI90DRAFT_3294413 [Cantharellus anzutake]|uniref:uncharacterized protein n=1 Tax=Cantharellus anzutake TaxID=1750568 RepID=UPI001904DFDB|nr:uncharacterized protein EI90DRAFT_3294413 [Cantharellus anzutake]KAF8313742.1 hypothetical protein EI90DRAFT_3294413 [Cantharellus anzutake]